MAIKFNPERLKGLREDLGLSQYDFGRKIAQPPQVISMYERGEITPSLKVLARLVERFEKPFDYFFVRQ